MSSPTAQLLQEADLARREHRPADARRYLTEAVALCRRAGGPGELLQALKRLGQIERDLGNGGAALALYEESVALCRKESDPLTLAHTVRHLGDIHQEAGHAERAEPCYREALALYRNHGQTAPLDFANAIRSLAVLVDEAGRTDEAKQLWQQAKDLYAGVNVREGVAECSARLASLTGAP